MNHLFSKLGNTYKKSPIELKMKNLESNKKPIFLSIGEPNPYNIPNEILQDTISDILTTGHPSTRYGSAEGDESLRSYVLSRFQKWNEMLSLENILITSGSTQGLDLICRLFINHGDYCMIESPTYSNIFSTMRNYGANLVEVETDENGLCPEKVEGILKKMKEEGKQIKLLCLIPNAQNPSGVTLSKERREAFYHLAEQYDFLIVEDDPYSELMFDGEKLPPLFSYDKEWKRVIYLNSFSKIITPGLRVAWMFAHPTIIEKIILMKQTSDSSSNPFTQALVSAYCQKGLLEPHIEYLVKDYKERKEEMMDALQYYFGEDESISWTNPKGGMFVWMSLPPTMKAGELLQHAKKEGVVFVPGHAFSTTGENEHYIRLCFAYCEKDEIREGIARLSYAMEMAREYAVKE